MKLPSLSTLKVTAGATLLLGTLGTLVVVNHNKPQLGVSEAQVKHAYDKLKVIAGTEVPPLLIIKDNVVNAWTNGINVTVTTGIMKTFKTEDEAAMVLAHEMAHNILYHLSLGASSLFPSDQLEASADVYGASLMQRAGYDICQTANWFIRIRDTGGDYAQAHDHPTLSYRAWAMSFPQCKGGL